MNRQSTENLIPDSDTEFTFHLLVQIQNSDGRDQNRTKTKDSKSSSDDVADNADDPSSNTNEDETADADPFEACNAGMGDLYLESSSSDDESSK